MNRPNWDEWYLFMAFWISRRSQDPSTKHGCLFVDKKHRPISFGYNGCPPNTPGDKDVLSQRPLKYYVVLHSEENAIINATKSLQGSTAYITGEPCSRCLSKLIASGVKRIIYGPTTSKCVHEDPYDKEAKNILLQDRDIELIPFKLNVNIIRSNINCILNILEGAV